MKIGQTNISFCKQFLCFTFSLLFRQKQKFNIQLLSLWKPVLVTQQKKQKTAKKVLLMTAQREICVFVENLIKWSKKKEKIEYFPRYMYLDLILLRFFHIMNIVNYYKLIMIFFSPENKTKLMISRCDGATMVFESSRKNRISKFQPSKLDPKMRDSIYIYIIWSRNSFNWRQLELMLMAQDNLSYYGKYRKFMVLKIDFLNNTKKVF